MSQYSKASKKDLQCCNLYVTRVNYFPLTHSGIRGKSLVINLVSTLVIRVREAGVKRISLHSEPKVFVGNIKKELAALPKNSRQIEKGIIWMKPEPVARRRLSQKEMESRNSWWGKFKDRKKASSRKPENCEVQYSFYCYSVSNLPQFWTNQVTNTRRKVTIT